MWNLVSKHTRLGINAESYKSENDPIDSDYQVAIFFSSYESRGLVSSSLLLPKSCDTSIIIYFREKDSAGLRDKYDPILLESVTTCSKSDPLLIEGRSIVDVEEILKEIIGRIPLCSYSSQNKWFIDTSVSPKPFFLGLLGYLRQKVQRPKLTLFNATAYYEKNLEQEEAFSFTEGLETYMWVPWLWGRPDPRLPWTYFFLLGFEGDRSYGTYERYEPQFVKALISDPGYKDNYPAEVKKRNQQFMEEACPETIYADAADAVQTWIEIDKCLDDGRYKTNICIVPLGPKPHAIGGALSALNDGFPGVLYLMPSSHKVRDVPRGDYVWKYDITL